MNKYAIERLESEKYGLMIENKEIELNKLSNKGMPMMVYEGNLRYIELLQSAIKQLSKKPVSPLNEDKIREIMSKYLKPNMLEWTHAIDKDKPVSSCIQTEKEYDDCVKELSQLMNGGNND